MSVQGSGSGCALSRLLCDRMRCQGTLVVKLQLNSTRFWVCVFLALFLFFCMREKPPLVFLFVIARVASQFILVVDQPITKYLLSVVIYRANCPDWRPRQ